jgi:hypothetical protein
MTPVRQSFRDLNIDLPDFSLGDRSSLFGQVPREMSFAEWIEGAPDAVQNRALGMARADFVRSGRGFEDLFDPVGRLLDLADLGSASPRLAPMPRTTRVSGLALTVTALSSPDSNGKRSVTCSHVCRVCGGVDLTKDIAKGDRSLVRCAACQTSFGRWGALVTQATALAERAQKQGM